MTYYYTLGKIPHKRHTVFKKGDGTLHHEEVMGIHGFAGIHRVPAPRTWAGRSVATGEIPARLCHI